MDRAKLTARFSTTREDRQKAIFSTLFIAGNQLQTLFDSRIPQLSLKQFMLLSVVRQAPEPMTLTQLGELLGCSRQNVKQLAHILAQKGFVSIEQNPRDPRAVCVRPTEQAQRYFQEEFAPYQEELKLLFADYTDQEVATLFTLLSGLFSGIARLEAGNPQKGEYQ